MQGHGGHDNAYTDCQHTNFYFDVHEAHFKEALDRFAQFFISPLMKKNAMERERNAVDSGEKQAMSCGYSIGYRHKAYVVHTKLVSDTRRVLWILN